MSERSHNSYPLSVFLRHEEDKLSIYDQTKDITMIGPLGVLANIDAIDYICNNGIPGCVVECGVWRGGSVAAMLLRLIARNDVKRHIFLFDTFAGMTEPTSVDKKYDTSALPKYRASQTLTHNRWCYSPLSETKVNISNTRYPLEFVHYIQGDIAETLPLTEVPQIALLRLDTDWYESTRRELEWLYPKVAPNGVVIIDDYGCWEGARQATDEYFQSKGHMPLLCRIDHTRRMFIKTEKR